jgi:sugar O-acyltransferase (sialic acid O-acetyltransferase NeuD family)
MKKIVIIGAGGFAKETYWLIKDCGLSDKFFCFMVPDKNFVGGYIYNKPIRPQSEFDSTLFQAVIAIGDPRIREKVVKEELPLDTDYPNLIHPNVHMSPWVKLGKGVIVCSSSIITCDVTIGNFTLINLDSTIGHDCCIGDFVTINPSVNISGDCTIGKSVFIGTNAAIRQGLFICEDAKIGMGAIVVKNIKDKGVYIGSPARKL